MKLPAEQFKESLPQRESEPLMKVDMLGCVRATQVPKDRAFLPVFEAVVNSIHSTEDRFSNEVATKGRIDVAFRRVPPQQSLPGVAGRPPVHGIASVTISDNGQGFTETNLASFQTAYTTVKADRGGKGVGRFSWLVVFQEAVVESVYTEQTGLRRRKFCFKPTRRGIEDHVDRKIAEPTDFITKVELRGVQQKYFGELRRGLDVIAERLFEHCFPYFVVGRCPQVWLMDEGPDESEPILVNSKVSDLLVDDPADIQVGRHVLKAQHVQQPHKTDRHHTAHLCAHQRQVETFNLSAVTELGPDPIPGIDGGMVVHHVFVSGQALDDAVDAGRTRLVLPEDEPLFAANGDLDMRTLKAVVGKHVNERLSPVLAVEKANNFERIAQHIRTTQPEYRHLLVHRADDLGSVKWTDNPRLLDENLYRISQAWDADVKRRQAAVEERLTQEDADPDQLAEELQRVIAEVNEVGQESLVRYVIRRRAVLNVVRALLGKNALESQLHRIIFPMKKTADQVQYNDHNLWLVDDTLSFYEYVASDISFSRNEVAPVDSGRRPDLLAFKTGDPPYQHVALLEIKRPERKDENPVEQIMQYAVLLRDGGAKNAQGMTMPGIPKSVRIDAYALVTLTPELSAKLRTGPCTMRKAEGDWRWFGGAPEENLSVEVLDFQAFVKRAEQRNRAFFVKLGLQ